MIRVDRWLRPKAPARRLAALRVLVGSFAVLYLLVRARSFLSLGDADPSRFEPVGVLSMLSAPVSMPTLVGCYAVAVAAGFGFVSGTWFRVTGPVFGLTLLGLCTYRSSWGQILWFENLMVLQILIVGLAPSADALTWPHRRHRATPEVCESYGAPLRLAALVTVATYVVAGVAKIRLSGMDWITSDTLRNHVAGSAVRAELLGAPSSPLGRWLVGYGWIFPPLAAISLLLEVIAPVALLGRRSRDVWVVMTWTMHLSVALLMYVIFPYPLLLIAFAPFYELEHLGGFLRRSISRATRSPRGRVRDVSAAPPS